MRRPHLTTLSLILPALLVAAMLLTAFDERGVAQTSGPLSFQVEPRPFVNDDTVTSFSLTVIGRVTDPQGRPVARALIMGHVDGPRNAKIGISDNPILAYTNQQGYFLASLHVATSELDNLTILLRAHDPDYYHIRLGYTPGRAHWYGSDPIKLENVVADDVRKDLVFALKDPAYAEARVVNSMGEPLEGIRVRMIAQGQGGDRHSPSFSTNADGLARLVIPSIVGSFALRLEDKQRVILTSPPPLAIEHLESGATYTFSSDLVVSERTSLIFDLTVAEEAPGVLKNIRVQFYSRATMVDPDDPVSVEQIAGDGRVRLRLRGFRSIATEFRVFAEDQDNRRLHTPGRIVLPKLAPGVENELPPVVLTRQ